MRISFAGAAQTVTGSCYLVETEKTSFLVDCGMHQGRPEETALNRQPFPFAISDIDFMILTHAHIDHSGRIPLLYREGFHAPIYTTRATAELCGIMLPDSGHIQEMESQWQSKKNGRAGRDVVAPLYTMQDGMDACRLFTAEPYDRPFSPAEDVTVTLRDAGHILGSAILEILVRENGKEEKIVFSGDLGNKNVPIMRDPTVIEGADYLVLESTYGDRLHDDHGDKIERFVAIVNDTITRGGNVVIPSFAVGRTQEIIYALNQEEAKFHDRKTKLMETPVYVDSPMAVSATKIFRNNEECFDEEALAYIRSGDNPLDFENLHFTQTSDESRALNDDPQSKIIISASGMCDAGRIKHHLKHNLWRKDSSVIFVGYQAVGTLGRRLVDGAKRVRIFDEDIAVNARIENIEGFSGHADRDGLIAWVDAMKKKPSVVILVHGEADVIERFSETLRSRFSFSVHTAKLDETMELGTTIQREPMLTPRPASVPSADAAAFGREMETYSAELLREYTKVEGDDARVEVVNGLRRKMLDAVDRFVGKFDSKK